MSWCIEFGIYPVLTQESSQKNARQICTLSLGGIEAQSFTVVNNADV